MQQLYMFCEKKKPLQFLRALRIADSTTYSCFFPDYLSYTLNDKY